MVELEDTWTQRASHLYVVGIKLDLIECVKKANQTSVKLPNKIDHLHIYCDELLYEDSYIENGSNLEIPVTQSRITIYSRKIFPTFAPGRIMHLLFRSCDALVVRFIFHSATGGLMVSGNTSSSSEELVKSSITDVDAFAKDIAQKLQQSDNPALGYIPGTETAGVEYRIRNNSITRSYLPSVPGSEIDEARDLLLDSGMPPHDSLLRLLNWEFSNACEIMLRESQRISESISILEFIQLCTFNSSHGSSLYSAAQELLKRLAIPRRYPGVLPSDEVLSNFYIPVQSVGSITDDLKATLDRWQSVESLANQLEGFAKLEKNQQDFAVNTIESIAKGGMPAILNDENEGKVLRCLEDVAAKRKDLNTANAEADKAKVTFNDGVKAFKQEQKDKLLWDCVTMGLELAVGIGVAVATCGAGAPLTVGIAAKAIEQGAKAFSTFQKIIQVLTKLAETMAKIVPKLLSSVGAFKKTAPIRDRKVDVGVKEEKRQRITNDSNKALATNTPIDYLGLMADWREFREDIDATFVEIDAIAGVNVINGAIGFRTSLRKVVIRGETVLEAQREFYEVSNKYYRGLRETKIREARCAQISDVAASIKQSQASRSEAVSLIRTDLLNIKRDVFLQFHLCLLSLAYLSTSNRLVDIGLSPNSSLLAYSKCLDQFRHSWSNKKDSLASLQETPWEVTISSTIDDKVFPSNWIQILKSDLRIDFSIKSSLPDMKGRYHVRIKDMYITLEGLTSSKATSDKDLEQRTSQLRYDLEFGPQVVDKDSNELPIQYWLPPFQLTKSGKSGEWSDPLHEFVRPALFCSGNVTFGPEYMKQEGWNLETVTEVKLHFRCLSLSTKRHIS